jgi:hypothetical protein
MPTNLTESDAFPAIVQVPNNGEPADQTAWSIGAQPLANRTNYLRNRLPGAAASYQIVHPLTPLSATGFAPAVGTSFPFGLFQNDVDGLSQVVIPLSHLPMSGAISALRIDVGGAFNSGHVARPDIMPTLSLRYQPVTTGGPSVLLGTQTDASGSASAYNAPHNITLTLGTPHVIRSDSAYYAILTGEAGPGGALANEFYVTRLRATIIP